MTFFPETTLKEIKAYLRANYKQGVNCPCCENYVRQYRRPITSAMAFALILLYKHNNSLILWTHVESMLKKVDCPSSIRGDFPKLKYWGLVQPDEYNEGYYRITQKGIDFVENKTTVISHVLLYNNKCYGIEGKEISVLDALKNKFDYQKLINGTL